MWSPSCITLTRVPRTCTGVSLQKAPDRTATNVTYTLLATTITEQ